MLQPLVHVHGWPLQNTPATGRIAATSPCGRIEVAAEIAVFHLWRITVRTHPDDVEPRWWATFSKETPAEIVNALVQALAADRHVAPEEIVAEWPGHPPAGWHPLLKAGWAASELTALLLQDQGGTSSIIGAPAGPATTVVDGVRFTSPDGTASLTHRPKPDSEFGEAMGPWMIEVEFGPTWQDQWNATLSAATPMRYLNMLTSAVVDPAPVIRTTSQISDATRTAAATRPAPPPPRNPLTHVEAEFARTDPRHPTQGHPHR
ncbi:DUF317 domain-containing protein [Kitasatospora sp. NRRL B-11411]|uniref:DUF317 domain-containing protein n=1 Tax=Kitasatospora sp. NRRL B-11411 TaxID=1463822 RepID=UPI0004C3D2B9|nr:DUF317 domain-containing protein [Kitasatospora sp. NRRL B-11411]